MLSEQLKQSNPITRTRHANITEDEVEWYSGIQDSHRFIAIARFDDDVPFVTKHIADKRSDNNLILNDKDDYSPLRRRDVTLIRG
jgi:hypothetical protein